MTFSGLRFRLLCAILAITVSSKAEIGTAITVSPSTLLCPFIDGLMYGKVSWEAGINEKNSFVVQGSGVRYARDGIDIRQSMFSDPESVAVRFHRDQFVLTLGRRWIWSYLYVQPSLLVGYADYENGIRPEESFRGFFAASAGYGGVRFEPGFVFDLNLGLGYTAFGRRSMGYGSPIVVDANLMMGLGF